MGSLWEGAFRETERLPQRDNQKVLEDSGHVQKEAACSYLGWPKLDGKAAEDQASQLCGNPVVHGQAGVPHRWDRMGRITDPGHLPEEGAQRTEGANRCGPQPRERQQPVGRRQQQAVHFDVGGVVVKAAIDRREDAVALLDQEIEVDPPANR